MSIVSAFHGGLTKTRNLFSGIFSKTNSVNDDFYNELEEALILADIGFDATEELIGRLKDSVREKKIKDAETARKELIGIIRDIIRSDSDFIPNSCPSVILIVGVNGVGKTTSLGKLAYLYKSMGRNVIIAAADTFRAAAAEQLSVWAKRANVPMIAHSNGSDPAAVVFDAASSYKAKNGDLLLVDTAGRLHNKVNLMNELGKILRVIRRELPDTHVEILLVLDTTTGQNAISQLESFRSVVDVSGLILTKLDGTAKGGITVALKHKTGIPVRFVGLGEGIEDFQVFDADIFAESLLETS